MRVRAITPIRVSTEEICRRQARYNRLAPSGWQIVLENLPETVSAPTQLATASDLMNSERLGIEIGSETDPSHFDALLPDCVLDPGVESLDAATTVSVLGITRLSANFLASLGISFSVMVRNQAIADEYAAVVARYGLEESFRGSYVLDLDVADISDTEKWNMAVSRVAHSASAGEVSVLFNGCSAVETTVEGTGVTIVDPTALALRIAGVATQSELLPQVS